MHTQGQVPSETAAKEKQTLKPYVNCPPSKGGPPWRATAARKRRRHKWQRAKCEEQMAKAKCKTHKAQGQVRRNKAQKGAPPAHEPWPVCSPGNRTKRDTAQRGRTEGAGEPHSQGNPQPKPRPRTNPARRGLERPKQRKDRRWAKCSTSQGTRKCRQVATDPRTYPFWLKSLGNLNRHVLCLYAFA